MADLVPNHHTNTTVVCCVVGLGVKERRAQNSGREHDLIRRGHIVGVHRLRRHQPLILIHRLAIAFQHKITVKGGGAAQILEQITLNQLKFRVVTPLIRVTDFRHEHGQLLQGLRPGGLSHPLQVRDRAAVCLQQVIHQFKHLRLMLRREMHRHILLADLLIERLLNRAHAAFPPIAQLLRTRKGAAVKIEIRLHQLVIHKRCPRMHSIPHRPQLPRQQRRLLPQARHTLKERRLRHHHLAHTVGVSTKRPQPVRELEPGELLLKLSRIHRVVPRLGVAVSDHIPVVGGNLGLMRKNQFRRLRRGEAEPLRQASQLKNTRNMLNIGGAHLLVLLLTVVRLIRQVQARLGHIERVFLRVLRIDTRVPADQLRNTRA